MKHKLVLQYPSSWWHDMWREGLPVGNGFTGASLYGGSKREILQLGRHDFWYDGDAGELPDVHEALKRQRKKMDEGLYQEASWEIVNQLNQNGYKASLEAHIPLARMLVTQKTEKGFKHFERGLDLEKALAYQQWSDNGIQMRREVFVSRAEDIVVYHLTADTEKGSDYHVELETYRNDGENVREAIQEIWDSEQKRVCIEGGTGWLALHGIRRKKNRIYAGFGGVARIELPKGGSFRKLESGLFISQAPEVLILIALYSNGNEEEQQPKCRKQLEQYQGRSFETLLKESAFLHQKLYHSAELSFGAEWKTSDEELLLQTYREDRQPVELVEKLWHYGRYLFICGSNEKANPFPLYGLWGGRYRPQWCHNMANENLQMIYWHSFVGNLVDYHQAIFRYMNERIPFFRENAGKGEACHSAPVFPQPDTAACGQPDRRLTGAGQPHRKEGACAASNIFLISTNRQKWYRISL